jgi:hypothetical protein
VSIPLLEIVGTVGGDEIANPGEALVDSMPDAFEGMLTPVTTRKCFRKA